MQKNHHNATAFHIESITGDNRRPGDPESGFIVLYRLHELYGWTGRKVCNTRTEAESFAEKIADSMTTTNVGGMIITDQNGDRVACFAYTPTPDEISELISTWNNLTGNSYTKDDFYFEPVTMIVKKH